MHRDEVPLTLQQVRRAVDQQFAECRDMPIVPVEGAGTVHRIFRVGEQLSARFPFVIDDLDSQRARLRREAEIQTSLKNQIRIATPVTHGIGEPSEHYPGYWSLQTWLPGVPAVELTLADSQWMATSIVELITGLRALPPSGERFGGEGRGGELRFADEWMDTCFHESRGIVDVPAIRSLWNELRDLPTAHVDVMSHRDLLPTNLLILDNALVGVIDVGGLGPADPSLDVMVAWNLFDRRCRRYVCEALGSSELEWQRSRAWALQQAMGTVWYYRETNPVMSEMGIEALARVLEG